MLWIHSDVSNTITRTKPPISFFIQRTLESAGVPSIPSLGLHHITSSCTLGWGITRCVRAKVKVDPILEFLSLVTLYVGYKREDCSLQRCTKEPPKAEIKKDEHLSKTDTFQCPNGGSLLKIATRRGAVLGRRMANFAR